MTTPKSDKAVDAKATTSRKMAGVPAAERRIALLKLLVKLGATAPTKAVSVAVLAEKLKYNSYDVYCLVYHKYQLAQLEFIKTIKTESSELEVFITKAGVKHITSA